MSESKAPLHSIIVPCRDSAETLERCVLALHANFDEFRESYEIILSLSDCTVETRELANKTSSVTLVEAPRGRGAARNAGFRSSRGSFVYFVDSDTLVDSNFIRAMSTQLKSPMKPAACVCPIVPLSESPRLNKIGLELSAFYTKGTHVSLFRETYLGGFIDTAASAFTREALLKTGGFNESLLRQEDLELSYRFRALGFRLSWTHQTRATKISNQKNERELFWKAFESGVSFSRLCGRLEPSVRLSKRLCALGRAVYTDFAVLRSIRVSYDEKAVAGLQFFSNRLGNFFGLFSRI